MASFAWLEGNVPPDARIEATGYTPDWRRELDVDFVRMPAVSGRYRLLAKLFADDPKIVARLRARESDDDLPWYDAALRGWIAEVASVASRPPRRVTAARRGTTGGTRGLRSAPCTRSSRRRPRLPCRDTSAPGRTDRRAA
jgi:hypothetical protein